MKKKNNKNSGFSLIEIIVVIFLIAFFSGAMFANYKEGNNMSKLNIEANRLASNIRLAQNNTLGAVKYGTSTPPGGWGVHFNLSSPGSYYIFADKNEDSAYSSDEAIISQGARFIEMDGEISIASTSVGNILNISFIPPDPDTVISDSVGATSTEATIVLETRDGFTKEIKVGLFGLIEILE